MIQKNIQTPKMKIQNGKDTEKKILDEDNKVKNDNFNQESFDYKKTLNDLENKFSFKNSSKMNIDSD